MVNRRDFLKSSLLSTAAMALPTMALDHPLGANDLIRVGVVGLGGKGRNHTGHIAKIPGVKVAALCDADEAHLRNAQKMLAERELPKAKEVIDFRNLLDDKDIDAVFFATPNHWHALNTVWACEAGKDVYVEKPIHHEIWEGPRMIATMERTNRIVQAGTQNRSDVGLIPAFKYIKEGNLGKIKWVRCLCYRHRHSIGKANGAQPIRDTVDYNLWCGPADMKPLYRQRMHYDWHWVWPTGNGDLGNQGIHEMDLATWVLGEEKLAPSVTSIGGRVKWHDDGTTANVQVVYLEYESAPVVFEVFNLPREEGGKGSPRYRGVGVGVIVQCENGYFAGGRGGGWIYDNDNNRIKQFQGDGGGTHQANFFEAVRNRKRSQLKADLTDCHISSSLCHMGNISHRLGKKTAPEEIEQAAQVHSEFHESYTRFKEWLMLNNVDISEEHLTLGPTLIMNPETEQFEGPMSQSANMYLKRNYREPFAIRG